MQSGEKSQSFWPMAAPMMAWSPQLWLGALFGPCEEGRQAAANPAASMNATLEGMMRGGSGWLKANADTGAELAKLASRRSQAYVSLAGELGKCRTPVDLVGLQMTFWQTAMQHHSEAARRIGTAWGKMLPLAVGTPASAGTGIATPHDRITFPEPKDAAVASRGASDRRSAA